MLYFENKVLKFDADKCCGCTVCIGVCEDNALSLQSSDFDDSIGIDANKCTLCGVCVKICPVKKFQYEKLNDSNFEKAIGFEIAYANDEKLRYYASSGGCTRTVAHQALKSGVVDTVYTLNNKNDSSSGKYYYSEEANSLLQTLNSQYRIVNFGKEIGLDLTAKKRLIIGTPCQIKAVKEFYKLKKITDIYYFALLCKQQKNKDYLTFLKKQYKISDEESIFFRGDGWPGKTGDLYTQIPFIQIAGIAFGKELWRVNGCKYCGDCLGQDVADLTMADPWGLDEFEDKVGKNLIFIWSEKGKQLLEESAGLIQRIGIKKSDALHSIDWTEYKRKIKQIDYYNHNFDDQFKALLFKIHNLQQRWYEVLFLKIKLSTFLIKVINKLPFLK
jgi:coenzyme F420-reducing hydrogenase beta subunit